MESAAVTDSQCGACANALRPTARFCDQCGHPTAGPAFVEHKQVTVLFADVVGSMQLASRLDPERLRSIMNELFNQAAVVVQRYQGTVDKFTGDGLMALFGAPMALEDHGLRACAAALDIQEVADHLSRQVLKADGVELKLRVGLNSGDVIVGEIGAGPGRYTAVGHPVGLAQRMEAAAPPGGVLCSAATTALVESLTCLGPLQHFNAKGLDHPAAGRQLLSVESDRVVLGRNEGRLFGRADEMRSFAKVFQADEPAVVGIIGAPGVGKSRLVREITSLTTGADVAIARCDVNTSSVAFRAVSRLLRALFDVGGLDPADARRQTAARLGFAALDSPEIQTLFETMGIADGDCPQLQLSVDGRRQTLVSLIAEALRARRRRTVLVLEDIHWIDAPSDEVLAQLIGALDPTSGTVVVTTCRPEYQGPLRSQFDHQLELEPLPYNVTRRLVDHIVGPTASTPGFSRRICDVAAGNPYFIEEIVRDLADRGVLAGTRGNYRIVGDASQISVPPTVIAVLTSRIDRLPREAKAALNAAAVIGSQFDSETLQELVSIPVGDEMATLVAAELVDQIEFVPQQRYCFHHPLVRKVAYDSQLGVTRERTHIRLASIIRSRTNFSDENAGLVAAHLAAAGALAEAYQWHMRAAQWLRSRDLPAARAQWKTARDIADRLADRGEHRATMRIAPRAMLTSTTLYVGDDADSDAVYKELEQLAAQSGDLDSWALGTAGRMFSLTVNDNCTPRAVSLAAALERNLSDLTCDAEQIGIIVNSLAFTHAANCDITSARTALDLLAATPAVPAQEFTPAIALRGLVEMFCGEAELGRRHLSETLKDARHLHPLSHASLLIYPVFLTALGIEPHRNLLDEVSTALSRAESFADQFGMVLGRWLYGTVLLRLQPDSRPEAIAALRQAQNAIEETHLCGCGLATIRTDLAMNEARNGRVDIAIEQLRKCFDEVHGGFPAFACVPAEALVDLLIERGDPFDIAEAERVLQRWKPGVPALDMWLLKSRALLARAAGDTDGLTRAAMGYLEACRALGATARIPLARRLVQGAA